MKIKRKQVVLAVGAVVALALVAMVVITMRRPPEVAVLEVKPQTVELALSVVGRARPDDLVQVSSPNPGQVVRLLADDGDQVTAGMPLATIRANVEQAQTEAEVDREGAAGADVTEARLNYNRTKTLHDRGFAADAALDSARVALQAAEANLAAASAQVRASAERAREYTIRAPMTGTILFRPLDEGQVVQAGETLFEMAGAAGVEIQAEVEEAYADALSTGLLGRAAQSGSSEVFAVRVSEVSPRVNAATGGRLIKVVPADGRSLAPGRSVDLTIVVDRRDNSLTIPRQAVLDATAAPKVLVVGADDRVTAREVSILRWPSTNAIITGGLKAGDRIVRDPAKVAQGGRIRPVVAQQGR